MIENSVIPECYGDTLLVKTLGFSSPNHKHGIGEVNNTMKKYFKNRVAVGLIDNDKGSIPSDFEKFKEIERTDNLILKRLPNTRHYLIIINPALEGFIESVGRKVNVPRPYRNDNNGFRRALKDFNVEKNTKITTYFNSIKQRNPTEFILIKQWIKLIGENKI